MGLKPLEFADCLLDSPYFRENVHEHERELERTNEAIKGLIKECKALMKATENLSKAKRSFAQVLDNFRFECIGEVETDDEILIAAALKEFAQVIDTVEDERDRMINHANFQLIQPLEQFRKEQIGGAKEEKKKFDKQTEKFCIAVQNYLNMSSKKKEVQLQEADAQLQMERRVFHQTALDYVFKLQEVNETKKFQFVETLLSFMYVQMTFFHSGHEAFKDYMEYMTDLQLRLQNTRDRFSATKEQAESLMNKVQQKAQSGELQYQGAHTRQGYLYVQEKRKGGLGYTWSKHYCLYTKENKILTMIPYVQTQGKMNACTDTMVITHCTRRMTETIDRRFCFDIQALDRPGSITLQALNEEDRKLWMEAMDGKEPIYLDSNQLPTAADAEAAELGLLFIRKSIRAVEKRGLTDQGLYRIVGVGSKVQNLLFQCVEKKKISQIELESDDSEYEVKTITSALKQHLRNMDPPLFTYEYHEDFLDAVKQDTYEKRVASLSKLVQLLPEENKKLIVMIMEHLKNVAANSNKNLMAASNLGVVFGPTLMKSREETMAAIMNLKYQSVVIELLVKEFDRVFGPLKEKNDVEKRSNSVTSVSSVNSLTEKPPLPSLPPKKKISNDTSNDAKFDEIIDDKKPMSAKSYPAPAPPPRPCPAPRVRKTIPSSTDSEEDENNSKTESSNSLPRPGRPPSPSTRGMKPLPPPKKPDVVAEFRQRNSDDDGPRPVSMVIQMFSAAEKDQKGGNEAGGTKSHSPPRAKPPPLPRNPPPKDESTPPRTPRRVRTLYPCVAENTSELSFDAGSIISNIRESKEPGWLEGTLNGRTGLVPCNYVEFLT
ncbi:rho GTPase-activating protein 26 isoform X1 [Nematostella vectensis]|uniref:rho GTPase-activating protein 26 isoform X1 n=1 Tax=Nematostella vectensis TaxID=45351 RepID=UPI00138FB30C|nr:rho GTPase-activating protein 26 isoform X1 [Nematostella vectensis]